MGLSAFVDCLEIGVSQPRAEKRARTRPLRVVFPFSHAEGGLEISILRNRWSDRTHFVSEPSQNRLADPFRRLQHQSGRMSTTRWRKGCCVPTVASAILIPVQEAFDASGIADRITGVDQAVILAIQLVISVSHVEDVSHVHRGLLCSDGRQCDLDSVQEAWPSMRRELPTYHRG